GRSPAGCDGAANTTGDRILDFRTAPQVLRVAKLFTVGVGISGNPSIRSDQGDPQLQEVAQSPGQILGWHRRIRLGDIRDNKRTFLHKLIPELILNVVAKRVTEKEAKNNSDQPND